MAHSPPAGAAPSKSAFRPDCLAGFSALVTGGTSGIGFEIARQLGLHGAIVTLMGRRAAVAQDAAAALRREGIAAHAVVGDVRKEDDVQAAVRAAVAQSLSGDTLEILINCAAGNFLVPAEAMSVNAFRTVLEIDTIGTFCASRAAFPYLKNVAARHSERTASIVNISATLQYGATYWQAHASAAKAAIDSLTRSLALEWGDSAIRCNGIAPGPIDATGGLTKLSVGLGSGDKGGGGGRSGGSAIAGLIPLGRLGQTSDIALAAVFLCSSAANFVTGDVLVVDGAHWMGQAPKLASREAVLQMSRAIEKKSRAVGIPSKL